MSGVVAVDHVRLDRLIDVLVEEQVWVHGLRRQLGACLLHVGVPTSALDHLTVAGNRVTEVLASALSCRSQLAALGVGGGPSSPAILLGSGPSPPVPHSAALELLADMEGRSWGRVPDLFVRFEALADDPLGAALVLDALGPGGLARLQETAVRRAGDPEDLDQAAVDRMLDRLAGIETAVLAASGTIGTCGGLSTATFHAITGTRPPDPEAAAAEVDDWQEVEDAMTVAGAGDYAINAVRQATGRGDVAVLRHGSRIVGVAGLVVSGADIVENLDDVTFEELAAFGLSVVATFSSGPVSLVAGGLALLFTLFAATRGGATPQSRTYPTDQRSPGGSHYEHYVDGAGVPVAPR